MIELPRLPIRFRSGVRVRLPQFFRPDPGPHLRFKPRHVPDDGTRYRMWVRPGVATEPVSFARLVAAAREPFPSRVVVERLSDLPTSKESL